MIYRSFQQETLSMLGFGAMRLPMLENGEVNEKCTADMVGFAMENGVNYFDTAWPYHAGVSETVLSRALHAYPRDRWNLADKFPGHQIAEHYDPAGIFEKQLKKCGVEYFDYYLLHNVYENSIGTYTSPRWGILDYFLEQKRQGRIRHLGFSSHGGLGTLKAFLDQAGSEMEFCQIQLNWLDWTLQDAAGKVRLLNERDLPIWVMEPVRGGRLCRLEEKDEAVLKALRPEESIPAWGFRFLQGIPGVTVVLSGMSAPNQMEDNVRTFASEKPLTPREMEALMNVAEGMKDSVPCTGCRYCADACPMKLDIPMLLNIYNDLRFAPNVDSSMRVECLPEEKRPSACLGCGACTVMCPQRINIPAAMRDFSERLESMPKWADISLQRARAQRD